ncbi:pre-mRNA cleavage and polyadenylation factor (CPF) complex subunit [Savitreella phatthalungensis]
MAYVVRNGWVFLKHANYQLQEDGTPKKLATRRTVDYGAAVSQWLQRRKQSGAPYARQRPDSNYAIDIMPPTCEAEAQASSGTSAADSLCVKFIHTSSNKNKHPVNCVRWTPDARRVLTASSSGEFTLWNGLTFNFETILQAHDTAVRALEWSPSGDWLISGDHEGNVQYAQPNMNIVKVLPTHTEAVRDLAWSPQGTKFCSASDDGTCKVWHFAQALEERTLTGHGWDVKSCDWHPSKGLIVTGSKDNLVKLWDPRTARCLTTLHGHKNTVSKVMFQRAGGASLLATCSRDSSARVLDLRQMRDLRVLRGHERDVTTLTWHPVVPGLLTTGGHDGGISHYLLDESEPAPTAQAQSALLAPVAGPGHGRSGTDASAALFSQANLAKPTMSIQHAHESAIWGMEYHPLGHLLATASNDRATRFWARARPGDDDTFRDKYHVGEDEAIRIGTLDPAFRSRSREAMFGSAHGGREERQDTPQMPDLARDAQKTYTNGDLAPRLPGLGGQIPQLEQPPAEMSNGAHMFIPGFANAMPPMPPFPPLLNGSIPGFGAGQRPNPAPGQGGAFPPFPTTTTNDPRRR